MRSDEDLVILVVKILPLISRTLQHCDHLVVLEFILQILERELDLLLLVTLLVQFALDTNPGDDQLIILRINV